MPTRDLAVSIHPDLLATLIRAADEGASLREDDARNCTEQGDPDSAQEEQHTADQYRSAAQEAQETMLQPQCNADLVADLLDTSPMHQLIIMEAIRKYAEACAKADPAKFDNPMLSGRAWVKASADIVARMAAFYGRHDRKGA